MTRQSPADQMVSCIFARSRRSERAVQAARLLSHYPRLSESERFRLVRIVKRLQLAEFALRAADDRLAPGLARFHEDFGDAIGDWSILLPIAAISGGFAMLLIFVGHALAG